MDNEIKIRDFLIALRKRMWLIISFTLLCTVGTVYYSKTTWTPTYQATAKLLLPMSMNRPELISTMGVIAKDPVVMDKVVEMLGLSRPSNSVSRQISFSSENGSQVVRISVVDGDPEMAANIANATASVFIREIGNILRIYDAKVLSEAKVDIQPQPINLNPRWNVEYGLAAGIVIGIGLALFLDVLNNRVQSEREMERLLKIPHLGSVSKMNRKNTYSKKLKGQLISTPKGGNLSGYERTSSL